MKTNVIENRKNLYSGIFLAHGLSLKEAKARYGKRRKRFISQLKSPVMLYGINEGPGGKNIWPYVHLPIYQEPLMLYLTGINQSKVALFISPFGSEKEILFLPPKDPEYEFWQGMRFGVGDREGERAVRDITGIRTLKAYDQIHEFVIDYLNTRSCALGLYWHQDKVGKMIQDSNFIQNTPLKKKVKKQCKTSTIYNISATVWKERPPLDKVDQANARKANLLTGEAFRKILAEVSHFKNEYTLCGALDGELRRRTPYGQAFPTIAASGRNATILHYEKANDPIGKGELFLVDFGLRWASMHADISRTFPVSGKFNPLQKLLYEIVLEAQMKVEKKAAPGVSIQELNTICWGHINEALEKRFLARGGKMKLPYKNQPHGVSHLIGEMVHDGDPFGEYKDKPMKKGWMLSNEPGIYGEFEIELGGKKYQDHIGIRIEDNLLITAKGCQNLSKSIPKKIAELEKLIG